MCVLMCMVWHTIDTRAHIWIHSNNVVFLTRFSNINFILTIIYKNTQERNHFNAANVIRHLQRNIHLLNIWKTQTGGRPYICNHCDNAFKHQTILADHIIINIWDELYQSSQFEAVFLDKSILTEHMRTHTGDIPYAYTTETRLSHIQIFLMIIYE